MILITKNIRVSTYGVDQNPALYLNYRISG